MSRLHGNRVRLITLGASHRVVIAAILVIVLWALFFWATSSPGGL